MSESSKFRAGSQPEASPLLLGLPKALGPTGRIRRAPDVSPTTELGRSGASGLTLAEVLVAVRRTWRDTAGMPDASTASHLLALLNRRHALLASSSTAVRPNRSAA